MGTTIEWVTAPGVWTHRVIKPEEFTDETSEFFDADNVEGDTHAETYGIVVDSGGHYTLIYGSVEALETLRDQVDVLASAAREHRDEARLGREEGTCDTCGESYPLSSREGRCGDCGECALHCPHFGIQVVNRMKELAPEWEVYWEYPGFLTLRLDDTHEMATGLHGWHYADINVLVDDAWEPGEETLDIVFECTAEGHNADPESCQHETYVATVADGIETAALGWQARQEARDV